MRGGQGCGTSYKSKSAVKRDGKPCCKSALRNPPRSTNKQPPPIFCIKEAERTALSVASPEEDTAAHSVTPPEEDAAARSVTPPEEDAAAHSVTPPEEDI